MFCEKNHLDFRIYFSSPFSLSDYLEPNRVNWPIGENEMSYKKFHTKKLSLFGVSLSRRRTQEYLLYIVLRKHLLASVR
jgi:hypothetical protein